MQAVKAFDLVEIPESKIFIEREEYEQLKSESVRAKLWGMKDLRKHLKNRSEDWIKQYILLVPKFQPEFKKMERQNYFHSSGGISGNEWWFRADKMIEFIDQHWQEINWNGKVKKAS